MIRPHIIRVYDPVCKRPVWQALLRNADGTRKVIASSKTDLNELADRIGDWHMWEIIKAKKTLETIK